MSVHISVSNGVPNGLGSETTILRALIASECEKIFRAPEWPPAPFRDEFDVFLTADKKVAVDDKEVAFLSSETVEDYIRRRNDDSRRGMRDSRGTVEAVRKIEFLAERGPSTYSVKVTHGRGEKRRSCTLRITVPLADADGIVRRVTIAYERPPKGSPVDTVSAESRENLLRDATEYAQRWTTMFPTGFATLYSGIATDAALALFSNSLAESTTCATSGFPQSINDCIVALDDAPGTCTPLGELDLWLCFQIITQPMIVQTIQPPSLLALQRARSIVNPSAGLPYTPCRTTTNCVSPLHTILDANVLYRWLAPDRFRIVELDRPSTEEPATGARVNAAVRLATAANSTRAHNYTDSLRNAAHFIFENDADMTPMPDPWGFPVGDPPMYSTNLHQFPPYRLTDAPEVYLDNGKRMYYEGPSSAAVFDPLRTLSTKSTFPRERLSLIPRPAKGFVDRQIITVVKAMFLTGPPEGIVCVYGLGGCGKTQLAIAVASDKGVAEAFPGGCLWLSVGESRQEVVDHTARLMDIAAMAGLHDRMRPFESSMEALKRGLANSLRGSRTLLVLDDVSSPITLGVLAVAPTVLVTSRCNLQAPEIATNNIALGSFPFSFEEAFALLRAHSGDSEEELRVNAVGIALGTGGHPLALCLLAGLRKLGKARGVTWASIENGLTQQLCNDTPKVIADSQSLVSGVTPVIDYVFQRAIDLASYRACEAFRQLSILDWGETISLDVLRFVASSSPYWDEWDELCDLSLLQKSQDGRSVSLHPLAYVFLHSLPHPLEPSTVAYEWLEKFLSSSPEQLGDDVRLHFERNRERYERLAWSFTTDAQSSPVVGDVYQLSAKLFMEMHFFERERGQFFEYLSNELEIDNDDVDHKFEIRILATVDG